MRAFAPLALGLVLLAVPAAAQVRTAPNNAREPIEIAADALRLSPGQAFAHMQRGIAYHRTGDAEAGRSQVGIMHLRIADEVGDHFGQAGVVERRERA